MSLKNKVEKIPGDEGFTKAGEEFHKVAVQLLEKGLEEDEILQILTDLYWAAASEYGA